MNIEKAKRVVLDYMSKCERPVTLFEAGRELLSVTAAEDAPRWARLAVEALERDGVLDECEVRAFVVVQPSRVTVRSIFWVEEDAEDDPDRDAYRAYVNDLAHGRPEA